MPPTMSTFASSTVDTPTPTEGTSFAMRQESQLTEGTNQAASIPHADEITPLACPDTFILKGSHCLLTRILHNNSDDPTALDPPSTFRVGSTSTVCCADFTEDEVAAAMAGMRKGPPSPSDEIYQNKRDVSHLTRLINRWWNNEPLAEDKKLAMATHDEMPEPAEPAPPTQAPLPLPYIEPILTERKTLAMNPRSTNQEGIKWFKKQQACLWTAEEIDTARDLTDFHKLSAPEQSFVKMILAFFASADSIVMDNLMEQFGTEVNAFDIKLFFVIQTYIEAVHVETYTNLLTAIVKDKPEQDRLFDAVTTFPSIKRKVEWMNYWTNSETRTFSERLIAFAAVEGIFFSGAFCAVFWLKKRGLLPGLSFANELISRDEGIHRDFAVYINNERLLYPAAPMIVRRIIAGAVEIETDFINQALPVSLIGMNADQMNQYIQFVADHLLVSLRQPKLFNVTNPFEWMEMISLQGKTNFFEKRVGEYALSGVGGAVTKHAFELDASF